MKEVVIIGSGIGGSAIGALLATKKGFKISLFEKNRLIGGRYASYERDNFKMDVGCHIIANCENGTMGRVLSIIGEEVKWSYTRKPGPVFFFKGEWLKFPSEVHKLGLSESELQNIFRMYQDITGLSEAQLNELDKVDMLSFLRRYVSSPEVEAIMGFLMGMYFVVPPDKTPAGEWIRCQQEMQKNRTSGYPVGGTGAIPNAYVNFMKKKGHKVVTEARVEKIIVEGKKVKGVIVDGKKVEADIVISNADVKTTVLKLIGEEHYPKDFVEKIKSYYFTPPTFILKIAVDRKITDKKLIMYIGRTDFENLKKEVESGVVPEKAGFLMIPVISNLDPTSCPEGKELIYAGWGCTYEPGKKQDWKAWEDSIMRALLEVFPEIEGHIMWKETASPQFIDALFNEMGNPIGVAQSIEQVGENRPPIVDPHIEGLFYSSADSGQHGIGGELAADAALRLFEILT